MAASVDQDEAVFRLQCRNEASLVPSLAAIGKAVLEDERWSIALDPVVDRNAFVVDARHQILPCVPSWECGPAASAAGWHSMRSNATVCKRMRYGVYLA